jgi:hypothetical protein
MSDKGPYIAAPRKRGQFYGMWLGGATGIGRGLVILGELFLGAREKLSIGSV